MSSAFDHLTLRARGTKWPRRLNQRFGGERSNILNRQLCLPTKRNRSPGVGATSTAFLRGFSHDIERPRMVH
jgi:hypothetical protein